MVTLVPHQAMCRLGCHRHHIARVTMLSIRVGPMLQTVWPRRADQGQGAGPVIDRLDALLFIQMGKACSSIHVRPFPHLVFVAVGFRRSFRVEKRGAENPWAQCSVLVS